MENTQSRTNESESPSTVWQIIGRLLASSVVLAITAFYTPGFSINNNLRGYMQAHLVKALLVLLLLQ